MKHVAGRSANVAMFRAIGDAPSCSADIRQTSMRVKTARRGDTVGSRAAAKPNGCARSCLSSAAPVPETAAAEQQNHEQDD